MTGPRPGMGVQPKQTKGPYRTPVVNDPALLATDAKPKKKTRVIEVDEQPQRKGESAPLKVGGEGGFERVRAAELVILAEAGKGGSRGTTTGSWYPQCKSRRRNTGNGWSWIEVDL